MELVMDLPGRSTIQPAVGTLFVCYRCQSQGFEFLTKNNKNNAHISKHLPNKKRKGFGPEVQFEDHSIIKL